MRKEHFTPLWCSSEYYEIPFDAVKITVTDAMDRKILDIQQYIKANDVVQEVIINFRDFQLLKRKKVLSTQKEPGTMPEMDGLSIETAHLVINDSDYTFKMTIDENEIITIEAYYP